MSAGQRPAPAAIQVEGVGKMYRIYARPVDRLKQLLWGRHISGGYGREFWAVKNASFVLERGEAVGIIGRNGSGKSTLLQMIAGTLSPTVGRATVTGRISALLELGSGMNPEFTGRQNIELYASVLGLSSVEIIQRREAIIAFADIGDFIDQPVKTYSSGMAVRLAFAVSAHVGAEVLIVDEALAVGDEAFVKKCYDRIRDFLDVGGTLLFVSHSSATIIELCDRAILIEAGEVLLDGDPRGVIAQYQRLLGASPEERREVHARIVADGVPPTQAPAAAEERSAPPRETDDWHDPSLQAAGTVVYDNPLADIIDPYIADLAGRRVNQLTHGRDYVYTYRVRFLSAAAMVRFGMMIKTIIGTELCGATTATLDQPRPDFAAGGEVVVRFPWRCLLNPGTYSMNAGLMGMAEGAERYIARKVDVLLFRVQPCPDLTATTLIDLQNGPAIIAPYGGALMQAKV